LGPTNYSFSVIFSIENSDLSAVDVILPAGLILVPQDSSVQSLMTVSPYSFSIAPSRKMNVQLNMSCISLHKHGGYGTVYEIKTVSSNNQVRDLINALSSKSAAVINFHNEELQFIIWEISDGNGLTQAALDSIKTW